MKKLTLFAIILTMLLTLCSCSGNVPENRVFSSEDLPEKLVGFMSDTPSSCCISEYESIGAEVRSYTDYRVMLNDVNSGSLDCGIMDKELAKPALRKYSRLKTIPASERGYSIITALESTSLMSVIKDAMVVLTDDGVIGKILDSYIEGSDYTYAPPEDIQYNGSLTLAVNAPGKPFSYYDENGQLAGIDIDIARAICDYIGVELNIRDAADEDLYSFVRSGKADFAMGCLSETEDTVDLVEFSEPYYESIQVIIVRKK